jgi:hypothetical protein
VRRARAALAARRLLPAGPAFGRARRPCPPELPSCAPAGKAGKAAACPKDELQQVFSAFASFGLGQAGGGGCSPSSPSSAPDRAAGLDSSRFAKVCREAGLLGGRFDQTAADLVFAKVGGRRCCTLPAAAGPLGRRWREGWRCWWGCCRRALHPPAGWAWQVKARGQHRIGYQEFGSALELVAAASSRSVQEVRAAVLGCGGPRLNNSTTPDSVRFYDRRVPRPSRFSNDVA